MSKSVSLKHIPAKAPPPGLDPIPGDHDAADLLLEETSVPRLLATAMLDAALTRRDRRAIAKRNGIALVVEVGSAEMILPVNEALRELGDFLEICRRDGSQRSAHRPDIGCEQIASLLCRGYNTAGISQAPERYLPATLTAAADIRLRLGFPSPRVVRALIRHVTGQVARGLGSLAGLSFLDVCSAIRGNGSARDAVRRLNAMAAARRAASPTAAAPHLKDTHGYGEAKDWGLTLAAAVEEWRAGHRPWSSIPDRNVVLGGPPGTGKTQFAVSLASTLGLPLVTSSVSAWFTAGSGYLNDVVKAIDNTFSEANAVGPCVLLLDELDAVPNRETTDSRHRDFWTPVVTSLLLALDGATSNAANLVVVGATNHPDRLDRALVRPGRLNKVIAIGLPDADAVVGILRQHLEGDLPGADLEGFGVLGAGSTGAEIAGWAKTARAIARAEDRSMTVADLVRVVAPTDDRPPELVRAIACHEAAHAVMTEVLGVGDLACVTIVERGDLAGRTRSRLRNAQSMTAAQVDDLVVTTLAGRAIDEILGGANSGAGGPRHSDLALATGLIASKIASWGLHGRLIHRGDHGELGDLLKVDRHLQDEVEKELRRLHVRALYAVRENGRRIERVARRLLQARVLSGDEVRRIIADIPAEVVPTYVPPTDGGPHA
ncbi:AAA family ATPase [Methylobacterium sp. J-067]|uniref:AAA family ATPase n=1 Tax=Methylobacterium sp. J-067 TaxID=2836648 RepID=UPI001FB99CF6|nr:AAA family ATPase [Methylobacterium sp. J-067]MCJ2026452.1 AAA family ATPase [Methylobacterium sp. J-067]